MKKIITLLVLFFMMSCSSDETKHPVAVGDPIYGGTLNILFTEKIHSLFPLSIESVYQQRLSNQIFETLLKFDFEGDKIMPALCENFSVDKAGKTYTFNIRKNVYFHDDPCFINGIGRQLTAEDVKYSLEFACSGLPENKAVPIFEKIIQGAADFLKQTKYSIGENAVSGIQVIDKHTLSITLNASFGYFEKMLTHSSLGIFPKEAFQKYGDKIDKHPIGTGAFKLETWTNTGVILTRNQKYWKKDGFGNQLPYLDSVSVQYSKTKKQELEAFKTEKIDLILDIPANEIENTIGTLEEAQAGKNVKHKLYSKKSLSVNFLTYTNHLAPFNNKDVRRAFNAAIDRNKLIKIGLDGQGYPITRGFVPAIEGYPADKITRQGFDVEQAKRLLEKAGFPNGKGFPAVEIYTSASEGSISIQLIYELQKQIKDNLNIDLKIVFGDQQTRRQAIAENKPVIWKNAWVADYPDPLNFLEIFGTFNPASSFSFDTKKNSEIYSKLLNEATLERNDEKRNELYLKCDQMIVDQLPVILLYNDDFICMVNAKVRNFRTNSMEQLDFSTIFISQGKKPSEKKLNSKILQ